MRKLWPFQFLKKNGRISVAAPPPSPELQWRCHMALWDPLGGSGQQVPPKKVGPTFVGPCDPMFERGARSKWATREARSNRAHVGRPGQTEPTGKARSNWAHMSRPGQTRPTPSQNGLGWGPLPMEVPHPRTTPAQAR